MLCGADSVGVFQVESRAQMSMLPRLRPRCYYDLVIEVAIVRPGPIVGDMVHPYLRRRNGEEAVEYPSEAVRGVLGKTLGVPIFQEQAMRLAIVAAGFSPGEADRLRRAMAAWKRKGDKLLAFERPFIDGMLANGYTPEFSRRCFEQLKGFSEYGFPESHAASFAHIVYASAWLKRHHPAAFCAALINSQPMGFYAPAQLVRDAGGHGVEVRPVDVNRSGWDCALEERWPSGQAAEWSSEASEALVHARPPHPSTRPLDHSTTSPALRLGMRLVSGLRQEHAESIARAVATRGPFSSIEALWRASGVPVSALRRLASADAFGSMGLSRREALWRLRALRDEPLPLFDGEGAEVSGCQGVEAPLPTEPPMHAVAHDYTTTGLSLKAHPMSFYREELSSAGVSPASCLRDVGNWPHGRRVAVAGLVLVRQRPHTASGIVFMTLEDETGIANLIVRPNIYQRDRRAARHAVAMVAWGRVERHGEVIHVLVSRVRELSRVIGQGPRLAPMSRDFH